MSTEMNPKNNKHRKLNLSVIVIVSVICGAVIGGGSIEWFNTHKKSYISSETTDVQKVIYAVRQHILLPSNETPALATVTDRTKLNSPLLQSTQNGDKVLIYQKNAVAIVYRPSLEKIVSVTPVSIDDPPVNNN